VIFSNAIISGSDPYFITPDPSCSPDTCEAVAVVAENNSAGKFIYKVEAVNGYNYNDVIRPELSYYLESDTCLAFDVDKITGS